MEPTFKEGQVVWVNNWAYLTDLPKAGDLVACSHNTKVLIKRIKTINQSKVELIGDNATDSLDSREFGPVSLSDIVGKVL